MVYLFLADGFEEVEALTPLDYLRRAGIDVLSVGIGSNFLTGAHGISVKADCTLDELADTEDFEALVLPGGLEGTQNIEKSEKIKNMLFHAAENGKKIAAICAAPSILGNMGLLSGKRAICYPGFEPKLKGAKIANEPVVIDGNIITAVGAGAAQQFSFAIIKELLGEEKAEEIKEQVKW